MHLTDHDRMEVILSFKPTPKRPRLFFQRTPVIRSLPPNAIIKSGDIVEDLSTGRQEAVHNGAYYEFLQGVKVGQAKEMPAIYDILRVR